MQFVPHRSTTNTPPSHNLGTRYFMAKAEDIKNSEQEKNDKSRTAGLKRQKSEQEDLEHSVIAESHATNGE